METADPNEQANERTNASYRFKGISLLATMLLPLLRIPLEVDVIHNGTNECDSALSVTSGSALIWGA